MEDYIIAESLYHLRRQSKLTQADIAYELDIHRSTYCRYESGEKSVPEELLEQLADFYQVQLEEIKEGIV
ncbi:helix-turn-helix domain-containing protein [Hutsoniella sourekii]|uniref:helix-turn-helix domain-containing protein n=1 Tax=Hutsoniella sourekii TaxID=87650 RepID=UPI0004AF7CC8|nr:helix-turn-helix transcriptional regulator [Hutsoniella sourekii]